MLFQYYVHTGSIEVLRTNCRKSKINYKFFLVHSVNIYENTFRWMFNLVQCFLSKYMSLRSCLWPPFQPHLLPELQVTAWLLLAVSTVVNSVTSRSLVNAKNILPFPSSILASLKSHPLILRIDVFPDTLRPV